MRALLRDIKRLSSEITEDNYNIGTLAQFTYANLTKEEFISSVKELGGSISTVKNGDVFAIVHNIDDIGGTTVFRWSDKWASIKSGVFGSCSWYLNDKSKISQIPCLGYCDLRLFKVNFNKNAHKETEELPSQTDNHIYLMNNIEKYSAKAKEVYYNLIESYYIKPNL